MSTNSKPPVPKEPGLGIAPKSPGLGNGTPGQIMSNPCLRLFIRHLLLQCEQQWVKMVQPITVPVPSSSSHRMVSFSKVPAIAAGGGLLQPGLGIAMATWHQLEWRRTAVKGRLLSCLLVRVSEGGGGARRFNKRT